MVTAVGSGGTAAGLALGLRLAGLSTRVTGVVVADQLRLDARALSRKARAAGALLRKQGVVHPVPDVSEDDIDVTFAQLGPGYGSRHRGVRARAARGPGPLDPVYSAKAWAALNGLDEDGPVLFLRTNGIG